MVERPDRIGAADLTLGRRTLAYGGKKAPDMIVWTDHEVSRKAGASTSADQTHSEIGDETVIDR